jgi:hypothetical protein
MADAPAVSLEMIPFPLRLRLLAIPTQEISGLPYFLTPNSIIIPYICRDQFHPAFLIPLRPRFQ